MHEMIQSKRYIILRVTTTAVQPPTGANLVMPKLTSKGAFLGNIDNGYWKPFSQSDDFYATIGSHYFKTTSTNNSL